MPIRSPFQLDNDLGLEYFASSIEGVGGKIRDQIEDFVVEELHEQTRSVPDGAYTHFTLEKRNWDTITAVREVARAARVSYKQFSFAGNKDRRAVTKQRVSAWRVEEQRLQNVRLPGIALYNFSRSDSKVDLGYLYGNRFLATIRRTRTNGQELADALKNIGEELKRVGVPNYFGYQRFGTTRPNTHLIGRMIVKGNIEDAVNTYIGSPYETESPPCKDARTYFDETRDAAGALKIYPRKLVFERMMLMALENRPYDYAGALRRLPITLRRLLVHAFQAYLFNKNLSQLIEREIDVRKTTLQLLGSRSEFSTGILGEIEKSLLEEEGVSLEDFQLSKTPEFRVEGSSRASSVEVIPEMNLRRDQLSSNEELVVDVQFSLLKSSYATTILREFMKTDPLNY
ncbi:MAG TPA: tRNA pseudouridine(13) synthase TruD [Candidatus Bathyarchaeia archaeon]|nr:tRNA pseudouridine(13) synthase TruD [Candidatus Bathyarchaeia archaeon]